MKNPNFEVSPKDIQRVMKSLDKAKDKYEVFRILATDDTIDKNHALNWMAEWYAQQSQKHSG